MADYSTAIMAIIDYAYRQAGDVAQAQNIAVDRRVPYYDLRADIAKSRITVAIESPQTQSTQATQGGQFVFQTDGTLEIAVYIPREDNNYRLGLKYVSAYIEEFRGKPTEVSNITFYDASVSPRVIPSESKVKVFAWDMTINFQFFTQRQA